MGPYLGGDRTKGILKFVDVKRILITSSTIWSDVITGDINSLQGWQANMGLAPNLQTYANLFRNYRVRGVRLKLTAVPEVTYAAADTDNCIYICSYANEAVPLNLSPDVLFEQPNTRYKSLNDNYPSGRVKPLTVGYLCKKIAVDQSTVNSLEYTGVSQPLGSTYFAAPTEVQKFGVGITTINPNGFTLSQYCVVKIEAYVYCDFWGHRELTS